MNCGGFCGVSLLARSLKHKCDGAVDVARQGVQFMFDIFPPSKLARPKSGRQLAGRVRGQAIGVNE